MKDSILDVLACPSCENQLSYKKETLQLVCQQESLAYDFRDGIPVLIKEESTSLKTVSKEN